MKAIAERETHPRDLFSSRGFLWTPLLVRIAAVAAVMVLAHLG